jgi:hypothetical protein
MPTPENRPRLFQVLIAPALNQDGVGARNRAFLPFQDDSSFYSRISQANKLLGRIPTTRRPEPSREQK